jgi:maltose/moltooligosaccharide transporter
MLPAEQRTMGFSMQSFFIGIGAIVASVLPWVLKNWFDIVDEGGSHKVPLNVHIAFYIGGAIFIFAVLWTVFSTKEYSPEQLKSFEADEKKTSNTKDKTIGDDDYAHLARTSFKVGNILLLIGIVLIIGFLYLYNQDKIDQEVSILAFGLLAFGIFEYINGFLVRAKKKFGFTEIINDLNRMPKTMKQLSFVQFFSWFALFAMWIYTTSGVTSDKYDMKLDKATNTELLVSVSSIEEIPKNEAWENFDDILGDLNEFEKRFEEGKDVTATVRVVKFFADSTVHNQIDLQPKTVERVKTILSEYNDGADWVGVLMGVYNGFAAIMAFVIMALAIAIKRKYVHAICLVIGGISFASFFFIGNPNMLLVSELGIGLAWASILAMPYAILTGSLPSNKMGVYMGIFNFFIVIPQIVAASILGNIVKYFFDGKPIYALLVGGVSLFIAAILVLFVQDKD